MKNGMASDWQIGWTLKNTYYKEGGELSEFELRNEPFISKGIIK